MTIKSQVDDDSGFFKELYKNFRNKVTADEISKFSTIKTDLQRVEFVRNHPQCKFPIKISDGNKSQKEAMCLKDMGNKCFQRNDFKRSLELYTQSILRYPENEDKKELSIIRANRSAALYHLERYELALKDIEVAEALGYPKELLFKIKDRKALCLLAMKQHKTGVGALRETIVSLDDAKLPVEKRMKKQKDLEIMTQLMLKNKIIDEPLPKNVMSCKLKGEKNKVYRAASKSVNIKYDESMGRYAVAQDAIPVGEVILKENAHCSVLLHENTSTHCFQCFQRLKSAEPCPTCCIVRFCSGKCRDTALKTHHGVECKILPTFWESGASVTCFMALRIISQHPLQHFLSLESELKEDVGLWLDKEYSGANYSTVYQLVRHENRRNSEDLLHRALMAVFLLSCLREAGYFKGLPENERKDAENFIGSLLLRQIQMLQFNAHEISELIGTTERNSKSIFLGAGLFPTLALFNHSCEPSIIRYFQGTTVVARTIKNIKAGEMIAENYGPIFTQTEKQERQHTLKTQYWFDCLCEPCECNWPTLLNMNPSIMRFRCDNKDCDNVVIVESSTMNFLIQCNKCGQQTNILKGLKVLQDSDTYFKLGTNLSNQGEIDKAITKFLELHNMLSDILVPPFKDFYVCQQSLKYCFMCLGNRTKEID